MLNLEHNGKLKTGNDADMIVINSEVELRSTIVGRRLMKHNGQI